MTFDSAAFPLPVGGMLPGAGAERAARQRLARVPIDQPPGVLGRVLGRLARKLYGEAPDTAYAMARHRGVLVANLLHERRVARFHRVDPGLKALAVMAVSVEIGCTWCVDFGYFMAHAGGLDLGKLAAVQHGRDAGGLTELERQVVEFAVAATATPPTVTDALVEPLRSALGDDGVIELTMMVAIENQRSRFNSALGLVSQGFSAVCQLPADR